MAAKKKRIDPVKQREKRVKIAAIVGVVLMVLVGAYEIPPMLAIMNQKPPANSTYDPGPSLTPGGLPNVAAGAGGSTAATAASGQLVDTDIPPTSGAGQLVSFSVFETKNPFTPQVSSTQAAAGTGPTTTTPTTANKPGADVPATTIPGTTGTTTTPTPPGVSAVPSTQGPPGTATTTTAAQPTVSLSVNGVVSHVASGGTFPSGSPVFRLSSWTKGSAQVAIVGGSYASGTGTLTLRVGEAVTLENQTDGKRYKLELLST
jgi:hypothetical protein